MKCRLCEDESKSAEHRLAKGICAGCRDFEKHAERTMDLLMRRIEMLEAYVKNLESRVSRYSGTPAPASLWVNPPLVGPFTVKPIGDPLPVDMTYTPTIGTIS